MLNIQCDNRATCFDSMESSTSPRVIDQYKECTTHCGIPQCVVHSVYGSKTRGPEDYSVESKHVALISHYYCFVWLTFTSFSYTNMTRKKKCFGEKYENQFSSLFNLLEPEFYISILAHSVGKMRIIQEPNKVELWNKRHFEEKKRRLCSMFKIFSMYICWINI